MKRIIISEQQAKNLVKTLVNEQDEPKKETPESIKYYKINSRSYFIVGGNQIFTAKLEKNGGPWIPDTRLAADLTFTFVKDEENEDSVYLDAVDFDKKGGIDFDIIKDDDTYLSLYEGNQQKISKGEQQPMQTKRESGDVTEKMRYVGIGYKGTDTTQLVPVYGTASIAISEKPLDGLEVIELKPGAKLIANKTCVQVGRKQYMYVKLRPSVFGISGDNEIEKENTVFYCVEYDNGSRNVRSYIWKGNNPPPESKQFIGVQNIVNATGPYQTKEEAESNCKKVSLPEVIPMGKLFGNNISLVKLQKTDIKSLSDFFAAGGKLRSFKIVASASKVPAGCQESKTKEIEKDGKMITTCAIMSWKDVKDYDNAVKGDNDDGTGNLQLTKARAFNLYKELLNLFPQLEGIPYKLEALGSTGLEYNKKNGDTPDDAKYAPYRRVDFLPNQ